MCLRTWLARGGLLEAQQQATTKSKKPGFISVHVVAIDQSGVPRHFGARVWILPSGLPGKLLHCPTVMARFLEGLLILIGLKPESRAQKAELCFFEDRGPGLVFCFAMVSESVEAWCILAATSMWPFRHLRAFCFICPSSNPCRLRCPRFQASETSCASLHPGTYCRSCSGSATRWACPRGAKQRPGAHNFRMRGLVAMHCTKAPNTPSQPQNGKMLELVAVSSS